MTETATKNARLALQAPSRALWSKVFLLRPVGLLALGDAALGDPLARAGLAAWSRAEGVAEIRLWGRAAAHHRDAIEELWDGQPGDAVPTPRLRAFPRFEPIDLILDAEEILEATKRVHPRHAVALLDPADPLERRLLNELGRSLEIISLKS
ncbi:MAG: hypothetical protein AAFW46_03155 [Pseudomonadota bacterium]